MKVIVRNPAVAGTFYPKSPEKLNQTLKSLIQPQDKTQNVVGVILPHAGYIYSGKIAGKTVSVINIPERAVILCPNHTGYGELVSVFPPGKWIFPGFEVEIDENITSDILSSGIFQADTGAHIKEHSAEVIIPFLHFKNPNLKISVICIRTLQKDILRSLANSLSDIYRKYKDILFIASSDMNHYEEDEISREKDSLAIDRIKSIDPDGFLEVCYNKNISVCGIAPVYVLLNLMKNIGVKKAELIAYGNSGEVNGDLTSVVGYAGIIFY